eukprot:2756420-Prymnesium_polylepis.1
MPLSALSAAARVARDRPRSPLASGGSQHRIWETRDWILIEGCDRISASPEHSAVAAQHRLR